MRWFQQQTAAWAMGLALLGFGPGSSATRLIGLTPEQLAERAERVVHGRVTEVEAARDRDGRIYTRVAMDAAEVWMGPDSGRTVSVEWATGGGILGEEQAEVVGQARFSVRDEVVVFLVRTPRGEWGVVGLEQGRFEVMRDGADGSGEAWVRNRFWGSAPTADPGASASLVRRPDQVPIRLAELRRRVQEVKR